MSSEEQPSAGRTGSGAYTAEGKETRDEHSPSPLPDIELREVVLNALHANIDGFQAWDNVTDQILGDVVSPLSQALLRLDAENESLKATQFGVAQEMVSLGVALEAAEARATQAEGERDEALASLTRIRDLPNGWNEPLSPSVARQLVKEMQEAASFRLITTLKGKSNVE